MGKEKKSTKKTTKIQMKDLRATKNPKGGAEKVAKLGYDAFLK